MASENFHRIIVEQFGPSYRLEGPAATAGTIPGMLLQRNADGSVQPHSDSNGVVQPAYVALETQTPALENVDAIDEEYQNGDTVYLCIPREGEVLNMWLGASRVVSFGDRASSNGDGTLQTLTVGTDTPPGQIVGVFEESIDNSGGADPVRILVRIAGR